MRLKNASEIRKCIQQGHTSDKVKTTDFPDNAVWGQCEKNASF